MCGIECDSKLLESAKQKCAEVRRAFVCIHAERVDDIFEGDCLRDQYLMDCITLSVTPQDIFQLKEKLTMRSKQYKTAADFRFRERPIGDYMMLMTPGEYKVYENSEHAVNAKLLFESLKNRPRHVSSEEFW